MPDRGFGSGPYGRGATLRYAPRPHGGSEPSLESLLVDPVLLAVLARNGVTVEQLREFSNSVGERLRGDLSEDPACSPSAAKGAIGKHSE